MHVSARPAQPAPLFGRKATPEEFEHEILPNANLFVAPAMSQPLSYTYVEKPGPHPEAWFVAEFAKDILTNLKAFYSERFLLIKGAPEFREMLTTALQNVVDKSNKRNPQQGYRDICEARDLAGENTTLIRMKIARSAKQKQQPKA